MGRWTSENWQTAAEGGGRSWDCFTGWLPSCRLQWAWSAVLTDCIDPCCSRCCYVSIESCRSSASSSRLVTRVAPAVAASYSTVSRRRAGDGWWQCRERAAACRHLLQPLTALGDGGSLSARRGQQSRVSLRRLAAAITLPAMVCCDSHSMAAVRRPSTLSFAQLPLAVIACLVYPSDVDSHSSHLSPVQCRLIRQLVVMRLRPAPAQPEPAYPINLLSASLYPLFDNSPYILPPAQPTVTKAVHPLVGASFDSPSHPRRPTASNSHDPPAAPITRQLPPPLTRRPRAGLSAFAFLLAL